jgi:hypothetical protein
VTKELVLAAKKTHNFAKKQRRCDNNPKQVNNRLAILKKVNADLKQDFKDFWQNESIQSPRHADFLVKMQKILKERNINLDSKPEGIASLVTENKVISEFLARLGRWGISSTKAFSEEADSISDPVSNIYKQFREACDSFSGLPPDPAMLLVTPPISPSGTPDPLLYDALSHGSEQGAAQGVSLITP